jgi:hypothetical protein
MSDADELLLGLFEASTDERTAFAQARARRERLGVLHGCVMYRCSNTAVAHGLCHLHYSRARSAMIRDAEWVFRDDVRPARCECETPDWEPCGPLFGNVRQCAHCGSPDRDQIGRWPSSSRPLNHTQEDS